jgi:hypothetical protein
MSEMSQYDLRSAFPLNGQDFVVHGTRWICRLAEVSDQRPELDRLAWYLVFEPAEGESSGLRKLEIVTPATQVLEHGWGDDLPDRLVEWLMTDEQDGRLEWSTTP